MMPGEKVKKPKLLPGEKLYIAKVHLRLNRGKLEVHGGDEVILGPADEADGINIQNLLRNAGIEPYKSAERTAEIKAEYENVLRPDREKMRKTRGQRGT